MYTDIIDLLEHAPRNITIQDSLTKAFSMIAKHNHILCVLQDTDIIGKVIIDILHICDFEHKINYAKSNDATYDLTIGAERLGDADYESCSDYDSYRPVFWYTNDDLQAYVEWMENRKEES